MRKNELMKLNHKLYSALERANTECEALQKENIELKRIIAASRNTANISAEPEVPSCNAADLSQTAAEPKAETDGFFTPTAEYAAAAIGKTVIEAAKLCGKLSAKKESPNSREQINLILGRCEVAKSEILEAVASNSEPTEQKALIDAECTAAFDYFAGVMAQ